MTYQQASTRTPNSSSNSPMAHVVIVYSIDDLLMECDFHQNSQTLLFANAAEASSTMNRVISKAQVTVAPGFESSSDTLEAPQL